MSLDHLKTNQRSYYKLFNSAFWGWLSTESQSQNPEFRINPENFHQCSTLFAFQQNLYKPHKVVIWTCSYLPWCSIRIFSINMVYSGTTHTVNVLKFWTLIFCKNGLMVFPVCYSDKHFVDISPGPEVIKLFSCSTQLSTKFILLINVKMPTIVGILTFISIINITFERPQARNFFICQYFMSSWNFLLSWVEHEKSFITSGLTNILLESRKEKCSKF